MQCDVIFPASHNIKGKVQKYPLYNAMCVPGLLDCFHPFVALTLLFCPQLQRLLSIVTKHNKEVMLKREREREKKLFFICDHETKHIYNTTPLLIQQFRFAAQDVLVAPLAH